MYVARRLLLESRGSAPAEFVLVGALLTVLVLAVLQLALAMHVRNTLVDAAAEGARHAALADSTPAAGASRTRDLISVAIGPAYAREVTARTEDLLVEVTVLAPLPVLGLVGVTETLEVTGHALREESLVER